MPSNHPNTSLRVPDRGLNPFGDSNNNTLVNCCENGATIIFSPTHVTMSI